MRPREGLDVFGEDNNLLPVTRLEPPIDLAVASSLSPTMPPRMRNFKQGKCKIRTPETTDDNLHFEFDVVLTVHRR